MKSVNPLRNILVKTTSDKVINSDIRKEYDIKMIGGLRIKEKKGMDAPISRMSPKRLVIKQKIAGKASQKMK